MAYESTLRHGPIRTVSKSFFFFFDLGVDQGIPLLGIHYIIIMQKAVIFDVGGVLCSPPQLAIAAYEKQLQLPR